jgi:hypothetical protein
MNQDQADRDRWRDDGGRVNTSVEKVTRPERRKHARQSQDHTHHPPRSEPTRKKQSGRD